MTVLYFQPNVIEVVKIVNFFQVYENIQVGKRNFKVCQTDKNGCISSLLDTVDLYQAHVINGATS